MIRNSTTAARMLRVVTIGAAALFAANAQDSVPALAVKQIAQTGSAAPMLTFRNTASSDAVAWLLVAQRTSSDPKALQFRTEWNDTTFVRQLKPIAPGEEGLASPLAVTGDNASNQFRLVAVLYADGSSQGDPNWARMVILLRQQRFELISAVIQDLSGAASVGSTDALALLERSKTDRLTAARLHEREVAAKLSRLTTDGDRAFQEVTPEAREANLIFFEARQMSSLVSSMYTSAESAVRMNPDSKRTVQETIELANQYFRSELHKLSESRPALFP